MYSWFYYWLLNRPADTIRTPPLGGQKTIKKTTWSGIYRCCFYASKIYKINLCYSCYPCQAAASECREEAKLAYLRVKMLWFGNCETVRIESFILDKRNADKEILRMEFYEIRRLVVSTIGLSIY